MTDIGGVNMVPKSDIKRFIQAIITDSDAPSEAKCRIEQYLTDILEERVSTLDPVFRIEYYLAKISGADVELPVPISRADLYLAALAGAEVTIPDTPNSSLEEYLARWCETGNVVSTLTESTVQFTGRTNTEIQSLSVDLKPIQDLHGYDSPWPAGGGKNGLLPLASNYSSTLNGITITYNSETESFSLSGTNSKTDAGWILINSNTYTLRPLSSETTYYFAHNLPSGVYGQITYNKTGGGVGVLVYLNGNGSFNKASFTLPANFDSIARVQVGVNTSVTTVSASGIHYGVYAENPTEWSPYSNICPITGWTGAKVTRTGRNLLDVSQFVQGSLDSTSGVEIPSTNRLRSPFILLRSGVYTISVDSGFNVVCDVYDLEKQYIQSESYYAWSSGSDRTITLAADRYVRILIRKSDNANIQVSDTTKGQLELASTATAYEPYQGTTYSITFPSEAGTVYGGTLDVKNGVLTVDRAMVVIDGVNKTVRENGTTSTTSNAWFYGAVGKAYGRINIISDRFATGRGTVPGNMTGRDNSIGVEFLLPPDIPNNVSALNQWFADNHTQLCYELATPVTYQLTPQEVKSLLGVNNIWSDSGDVTVTLKGGFTD